MVHDSSISTANGVIMQSVPDDKTTLTPLLPSDANATWVTVIGVEQHAAHTSHRGGAHLARHQSPSVALQLSIKS